MNATVVCGLLGAGKTTFLLNVLRGGVDKAVVLVNDFGDLGVDGELLSGEGVEAIQLRSGCVCCTLKTDLVQTLERAIAQFEPRHLFIEPSGVATPSGVLEALASFPISGLTVVAIVDATDFLKLHEAQLYGRFFEDQVECADVVLVNKADLAEEENVARTVDLVRRLNPRAIVVPTVGAVLSGELPAHSPPAGRPGRAHELHMETAAFPLVCGEFERCHRLFQSLAGGDFGNVRRAKALVQTERGPYRFDLASGRVDAAPLRRDVARSRLVVIGESVDVTRLGVELGGDTAPPEGA